MSFLKKMAKIALPVGGAVAGGIFGGPMGAMAGGSVGGALSGMIGAGEAARNQEAANAQNIAMQREFAQNGVRWKVADSIAAGIHPLVGLGAPTQSFQASVQAEPTFDASGLGQDLGRAIASTQTANERQLSEMNIQGAALDLQGKALDNQIKASQLNKINQVGPAFPGTDSFIPGQGNSGSAIMDKPMERTRSLPGSPEAEPGAIPDVGWAMTKTGIVPIPSGDVKNRIEDNMPHEWAHFARNNVAPIWGGGTTPPKEALPKGATSWKWNAIKMEYQPKFPTKVGNKPWDKHIIQWD